MVTLAFGEVLLLFLKSLRTPVVPHRLFPLIARVTSSDDTFEVRVITRNICRLLTASQFLGALPHESANVGRY